MIAKNLKYLRTKNKETQTELANQLYISQSRIHDFENGKPVPQEILKNIAHHYRVSEYVLKYTDLSEDEHFTEIPKKETVSMLLNYMFPMVKTPQALDDNDFMNGYNSHSMLMDDIQNGKKIEQDVIVNILVSFRLAWERNKIIPAIANYITVILLYCTTFNEPDNTFEKIIFSKQPLNYLDIKNFYLRPLPNDEELKYIEKKQQEFFNDNDELIMSYIKILKENTEFCDLADFLIAIMPFVGFVDEVFDCQTNQMVALHMLSQLCKIDNKYAVQLFSLFM